ncbi:hypothetical protein LCI18_002773 [Fusarium solani-melongenae]|uniref:Uncharacterized protein n=1 Tax=Fusarium solani subsp. cucurbitae TaxID=2747967 RepID=A0ACD3YSA1_FUSSC|nr:hypothetical protein LCI18_002773 [Fusarium solani-melongenae]
MAAEHVNKANPLDEAQINEAKDVQDSKQDSNPGLIFEKWQPLMDAITAATWEAFPASPPFDASSPSTFQIYWRDVFTRLRDSVLNDQEIPHYLTEPPVSTHVLGCPCCQSDSEPAIKLKNENGVTKEDLINAFIDTMYGEALPKVFIEENPILDDDDPDVENYDGSEDDDDPDVESYDGSEDDDYSKNDSGVLVYTCSWMTAGNKEGGQVMYGDKPDIVLYCIPPDRFEKKAKKFGGRKG